MYLQNKLSKKSSIQILQKYYKNRGRDIEQEKLEKGYALPPERVYIALNNTCQCKCVMCANSHKETEEECSLELETLEKSISELAPLGTFFVFYRQEPLVYQYFKECLDIINKYDARCQITTNALLLDVYAEKILDSNVETLWISLDGPQEVHNTIRNYDKCFEKVINNLRIFQELRKKKKSKLKCLGISTSCHAYNYTYLEELAQYVNEFEIDMLIINQMRFCTVAMAQNDIEYGSQYSMETVDDFCEIDETRYIDIQERIKKILGSKVIFNPEFKNEEDVNRYFKRHEVPYAPFCCMGSWFSCDITPEGEVILCNILKRFNPKMKLKNRTFMEIWNSEEVKKLRLRIMEITPLTSCGRCSHLISMPNIVFEGLMDLNM